MPAIADLFECAPVRQFGLEREARDEVIRDFAKQHGYAIVTADRDFLQLADALGAPPQVIRLEAMDYPTRRSGNAYQEICVGNRRIRPEFPRHSNFAKGNLISQGSSAMNRRFFLQTLSASYAAAARRSHARML